MRRLAKIILSLLVLFILAAIIVPFVVPADKVKGEILAQIQARTGRKVSIDHVTFSIFPTLALDAEGVKVSNPDWAGAGNMAEIKTLKLGLELMPLLHSPREYRLKELTLVEPVIVLEKQKDRANWDFGKPENKTLPAGQEAQSKQTAQAHGSLADLHLGAITVKHGQFTYKDDTAHKTETLSDVDFTLKAPNLLEKAEVSFTGIYNGTKAEMTLDIGKPLFFQSGDAADVKLKVSYGAYAANWKGTLATKGNVPTLTGALDIPSLDLRGSGAKDESGKPAADAGTAPENASRWSDAPIDMSGLLRANADMKVSIGSLALPKTTLKDIEATIKLQNGALQVSTSPINAYGGVIQLALGLNANGNLSANFSAQHAEAEPLLHDFASYDRLSGKIDLKTQVTAQGKSQRALINSLGGSGNVDFKDGKLKGVNLAAMLRNLGKSSAPEDEAGTDFSALSASFTIARGVVTTNDVKLASPLLRVTGAGSADLPSWQEHFLLKPMLVASAEGQGGKDAAGIVVPVAVDGPLNHPHYQPDLKAAIQENLATLKDPKKLERDVKSLKKNLLQGNGIQNLLR